MALAGPALAQPDQTSSSPAATQLDAIIVTANRREQNLQDVPIAVTAVTAASVALRGIEDTRALTAMAPGLQVTQNGNSAMPFLRGVGFFGGHDAEPSVAVYVDGVYYPSPNANFFSLNSIERVEVLKGPQGTLFGRNATGGVIQIITRDPSYEPTFEASLGYANYDRWTGGFYASTGLGEKAAINLAFQGHDQKDGWGKNLTTGSDSFTSWDYSIRGKLLVEPTDDFRVLVSARYGDNRGAGVSPQPAPNGSTNFSGQAYPGRYNIWGEVDDYSSVESYGGSVRLDYDAGLARLVSISAYHKTNGFFRLDQDASPVKVVDALIGQGSRMYSQEVQLLSAADSPIDWLVGAYYFDYQAGYNPIGLRSISPANNFDIEAYNATKSTSVFGQATAPLSDSTNLTGGLRYTRDKQRYGGELRPPGSTAVLVGPLALRQSVEKLTWRLSLDHRFNPDLMAYASANRGFKSGGFSLVVVPGSAPPYEPEVLTAYEVGFKSTQFDGRMRLNGAAYFYDYKNIQFQQIQPGRAFLVNGPKAENYGFELEAQFAATERLNLFASTAYVHTKYKEFPNAPRFDQVPASGITPAACVATGSEPTSRPGSNCPVLNFDATGNQVPYSPKWSYNLGGDYTVPTSAGDITLATSLYYSGSSYSSPDNRLKTPDYYLLNASVNWTSPDKKFGVSVWGRNLLDEYYYTFMVEQAGPFGDIVAGGEPLTYGVTLRVKY